MHFSAGSSVLKVVQDKKFITFAISQFLAMDNRRFSGRLIVGRLGQAKSLFTGGMKSTHGPLLSARRNLDRVCNNIVL